MNSKFFQFICAVLLALGLGYMLGANQYSHKKGQEYYFTPESASYLKGIKIDLPEEISTVTDYQDSTLDLLTAVLDRKDNVLYLGFSNLSISKQDAIHLNEDNIQHLIKPVPKEINQRLFVDSQ